MSPAAAAAQSPLAERKRQIAHVIFRLDVGGLENGLVNLINRMPVDRYGHSIICLTGYTDFRRRIHRDDVRVYALDKRPGNDVRTHIRLWRLLRALRPDIVHTRNLPTLDCIVPAALAGVSCRVHGEHGWDVFDLHGRRRKYRWLRRALGPLTTRYVTVSKHLERWLVDVVHVPPAKIRQISNGVDTDRFRPASSPRPDLPVPGFADRDCIVIGWVGRLQTVKDPANLVHAFNRLLESAPDARRRLRLVLIGDGPLETEIDRTVRDAGITGLVWRAGMRGDVSELLRAFDIFALPSLNEGISNSILEAMATGLPVVATDVGGNGEIVQNEHNGVLVPPADADALARALAGYIGDAAKRRAHGQAGRARVLESFSLHQMVAQYTALYDAAWEEAKGHSA